MKKATEKVLEIFPVLESKITAYENVLLIEESMKGLNEIEKTFLKLIWFFEEPESQSFDIRNLYLHLTDEWLELTLELITDYFREETYLIQTKPTFSIIKEDDEYLGMSQLANYLTENGLNYSKQRINMAYKRGKMAEPDLVISGMKYWSIETAEKFLKGNKLY
ncbi:hypothetical protein [Cytobacillus kochii]|uniref:Uncharacterized protein n=1 Tax=Cytobacillus kochii TaxID=859143 RepID=A0A248TPR9_9BACI|nr:hypothetical protein [Cytobacillus kochii]ASV70213.1 hypothetical protein CKF48_23295 [Cytobacillus kochii]